jgi:uncharacterized protein YukE
MSSAIQKVGQGGASFTALLGPIGLVTAAIAAAYETYRQFSGAAKEAENRQEAFAAASGDLTSKLEALAEKGFVPATRELEAYSRANLRAQIQKELLAKQIEKIGKALVAEADAQKEVTRLQELYARASKDEYQVQSKRAWYISNELREAKERLGEATANVSKSFKGLNEETARVNKQLAAVGETYKGFEKQTQEALETKAKELIAQRKSAEELKAEASGLKETTLLIRKRDAERRATANTLKLEGMTREQLASFVKAQEAAIKALNVEALKDKRLAQRIAKINADAAKTRGDATDSIKAQDAALAKLAIQQQRQLVLESQLRQLTIKLTKEGDDELLALARERHETGLQLAKDNAKARAIVEMQYRLDTTAIMDAAEKKEKARLDRLDKDKRDRLKKRLADENKLRDKALKDQQKLIETVNKSIEKYGEGLAQAGVASLLFGDGFKKAAGEVLKGLAIESGVRALMEAAKGFAMLFIEPADSAAAFKSAALYTAAAGAARVGAGALGVGGGGGGGTTASPSGAPQVASTPERESAQSEAMVFNINFGGAVIYDTRRAAEVALADRITRLQNAGRRGAPMRRN